MPLRLLLLAPQRGRGRAPREQPGRARVGPPGRANRCVAPARADAGGSPRGAGSWIDAPTSRFGNGTERGTAITAVMAAYSSASSCSRPSTWPSSCTTTPSRSICPPEPIQPQPAAVSSTVTAPARQRQAGGRPGRQSRTSRRSGRRRDVPRASIAAPGRPLLRAGRRSSRRASPRRVGRRGRHERRTVSLTIVTAPELSRRHRSALDTSWNVSFASTAVSPVTDR